MLGKKLKARIDRLEETSTKEIEDLMTQTKDKTSTQFADKMGFLQQKRENKICLSNGKRLYPVTDIALKTSLICNDNYYL